MRYRNSNTGDVVERDERDPRLDALENWSLLDERDDGIDAVDVSSIVEHLAGLDASQRNTIRAALEEFPDDDALEADEDEDDGTGDDQGGAEPFDPAGHTVAEVTLYLKDATLEERERVIQAEVEDQSRKGILEGPYSNLAGL